MTQRFRNWCFTFNNPPKDWKLENENLRCAIYQLEVGENKTEHFQGYAEFTKPMTLSALKKIDDKIHWEPRKGTRDQAISYCQKEDTRIQEPIVIGELKSSQGKRNDLLEVSEMISSGSSISEVVKTHPDMYIKFNKGIEKLKSKLQQKRNFKTKIVVYIGPTGCGKSRIAEQIGGDNCYWKPKGEWFDNYENEDVMIIDDFHGDIKYTMLLNLLDRYPLLLPFKGGFHQMTSKQIIITSNVTPCEWYSLKSELYPPLLRRIDEYYLYDDKECVFKRGTPEVSCAVLLR